MQAVKPAARFENIMPIDPELLKRIRIATEEIRRGETQPLEKFIAEFDAFIQEKYPGETLYNNNKQKSRKRPF